MTTQHTYSTPYGGREIYRDGKPFAVIGKPSDAPQCVEYYNELSAFGRMAAAAPDLLVALERIVEHQMRPLPLEQHHDPTKLMIIMERMANEARAAIAKAKGSEVAP